MTDLVFAVIIGMLVFTGQLSSWGFLVSQAYKPDLVLVLVIWAAFRLAFLHGLFFSFFAGLAVDHLSGAPPGLFTVLYSLVFVCCGSLGSTVRTEEWSMRAMMMASATALTGVAVLAVRWLLTPDAVEAGVLQLIAVKSLGTALAGLAIFAGIDWLHTRYNRVVGLG